MISREKVAQRKIPQLRIDTCFEEEGYPIRQPFYLIPEEEEIMTNQRYQHACRMPLTTESVWAEQKLVNLSHISEEIIPGLPVKEQNQLQERLSVAKDFYQHRHPAQQRTLTRSLSRKQQDLRREVEQLKGYLNLDRLDRVESVQVTLDPNHYPYHPGHFQNQQYTYQTRQRNASEGPHLDMKLQNYVSPKFDYFHSEIQNQNQNQNNNYNHYSHNHNHNQNYNPHEGTIRYESSQVLYRVSAQNDTNQEKRRMHIGSAAMIRPSEEDDMEDMFADIERANSKNNNIANWKNNKKVDQRNYIRADNGSFMGLKNINVRELKKELHQAKQIVRELKLTRDRITNSKRQVDKNNYYFHGANHYNNNSERVEFRNTFLQKSHSHQQCSKFRPVTRQSPYNYKRNLTQPKYIKINHHRRLTSSLSKCTNAHCSCACHSQY